MEVNYRMRNVITSTHREIFKVIKSSRMKCGGYVAHTGEMTSAFRILFGETE